MVSRLSHEWTSQLARSVVRIGPQHRSLPKQKRQTGPSHGERLPICLARGPGPGEIDRLFRINVHAPYHAYVEAARQMPEDGRIIVIGSVNGDRMPVSGMASYALKGGLRQPNQDWADRERSFAGCRTRGAECLVREGADGAQQRLHLGLQPRQG
ncbi:SDR family NAD(P)-dependent oxidoreductase [Mesorhizobium sp. M0847]|uniref:SDR family NAD(P)-dependent oxidoreductase n=1 Tax=unclassified Mesorhizobium TaxID=325217 RepID=UPI00333BB90A